MARAAAARHVYRRDELWFVPRYVGIDIVRGVFLQPANRDAPAAAFGQLPFPIPDEWERHPIEISA